MPSQADKAQALRQLHRGATPLLLPNAWDAGSAALLARREFAAIATTSGGMAWSLGYGDGEQAPLAEVLACVARIARVITLPLTVDLETGYGDTPAAVAQSVRAVIEAGAVGINLEDGLPGHGPLRALPESAERIRAARETATAAGVPIVINARVDCWMQAGANDAARFEEAVARGRAYLDAGADCLFPIGLNVADTLAALVRRLQAPISVAAGPGMPDVDTLARLGVARISTATRFATLAYGAIDHAAAEWLAHGLGDSLASNFSYHEAQQMLSKAASG